MQAPTPASDSSPLPTARRVYLNGATIMTTPTARHIEVARSVGFDGVEVRAERLLASDDPEQAVEARAELNAAANIVRPGEVWSLNGIQFQLLSNEHLDRARMEAEIEPRLAICKALGAAYLLVVPPRTAGVDRDHAIRAMQDGLALARDRAARDGVRLAFEFLGFGDCPIDTPALAGEVVGGVEGVDLVLDSCHWHASGSGALDTFPVDRLAMVHLNDAPSKPPRDIEDADRVLPGEGVIRLSELLAQLRERGYGGPYSLETFNPTYWSEDPQTVAERGKNALSRLFGAIG